MKKVLTFYRFSGSVEIDNRRRSVISPPMTLEFMSKKTERKNKTNLNLVWPKTPYFTIEDLHSLNADFVNITLRVRLTKQIEAGVIAEIGSVPGGQGRPRKVFALTPVTDATLELAKSQQITPVDKVKVPVVAKATVVSNIVPKLEHVAVPS